VDAEFDRVRDSHEFSWRFKGLRLTSEARSTTWTLLNCSHKASGLSARVINQMLTSAQLPQPARDKIVEYLKDRLAGHNGYSAPQCQKFAARLSLKVQPAAFEIIKSSMVPIARTTHTTRLDRASSCVTRRDRSPLSTFCTVHTLGLGRPAQTMIAV
jgi:hypothetical protein